METATTATLPTIQEEWRAVHEKRRENDRLEARIGNLEMYLTHELQPTVAAHESEVKRLEKSISDGKAHVVKARQELERYRRQLSTREDRLERWQRHDDYLNAVMVDHRRTAEEIWAEWAEDAKIVEDDDENETANQLREDQEKAERIQQLQACIQEVEVSIEHDKAITERKAKANEQLRQRKRSLEHELRALETRQQALQNRIASLRRQKSAKSSGGSRQPDPPADLESRVDSILRDLDALEAARRG